MNFTWRHCLHSPLATPVILALFAVVHLLVAPLSGLGVDEAHYALYGRFPDWSYFDHPPMVGWIHWLFLHGGDSAFWVRLPALVLWLCIFWQLKYLTQALYHSVATANLAVLLAASAPLVQVLGFGLVPDTPLILCALLLARLVLAIDQSNGARLTHWLLLGVLLGLAGLSKYTAVFSALALLWVLSSYRRFAWLASPGPWLAVVVAAVVVAPVFWWNWTHDWVSFEYQFNHGAKGEWQGAKSLRYAVILLLSYGPLWVFAALAGARTLPATGAIAASFLRVSALLLLITALWSAGNGEDLPHWTAMAWVLLAPFAAARLRSVSAAGAKLLVGLGAVYLVLVNGVLWLLLIAPPLASEPKLAPAVRDLHGWEPAAQRLLDLRDSRAPGAQLWVRNWTEGSRMAWYTQMPVRVLSDKTSQFSLWWGEPVAPAILVRAEKRMPRDTTLKIPEHLDCRLIDTLDFKMQAVTVNVYLYYLCATAPANEELNP
ncbi:ArnT family glycosyltransferase [Simiduia agarivorans]|uniref:Glycosyltransferase n=1 Tax=Simiduia agarivorans (strain DSM 21679 / JCM 13881 / BCRC 17597 / SA1) TaxID=1117647 RepID=K4KPD1_SIMAS|nr:glycosyltransferase family 39 protein [Simiduia agarivorans]AFV00892.1 glycosyltransferase [Simiduia agarivorans SA1 = DSM 21679]